LVDMEFEVEDAFLNEVGIAKSQMTLVDEERQTSILSKLHGGKHKKTSGGSAANTMIGVAQFGGKSFYSCKVSKDDLGQFYYKDLLDNGVQTNLHADNLEEGITGKCMVLITPDGDRTMNTFLGITSNFSTRELIEEEIKNSNYLYIEGYLVASPSGKEASIHAKKFAEANGIKTSITFSDVSMVKFFGEGMREIIGSGVDLLFCNEAEAFAFTETTELKDAVAALKKIAKAFAITLGSKGAFVFDGVEEVIVPTQEVKAIDTNGAGDLFAGAVLYGINNGLTYAQAAKLGCRASSQLVTQFGARLAKEQAAEIKSAALSKKYDVYGIGNALVDMEFEVEDAFLNEVGIAKSQMTLVDEERQTSILSKLHGGKHKKTSGGSAANTMIGVAQFGGKSFYSCKVSKDDLGQFYYKDLLDNGVQTNLHADNLENGITGKCMVLITPDGDRTMNTFLGITSNFSTKELVEEEIKNSNYLYIEGYLVASPSGKEASIHAKKFAEANGIKTSITFSDVSMVKFFGEGMREIIGSGVDLLFCNEAEAFAFTETTELKDAVAALKKIAKAFAITLGSKGAFVFDGVEEVIVPTQEVKAIDTNGAGDLFAGAVLYGINNGLTYAQAAKLGCRASSQLVTQFGARLAKEQAAEIKKSEQ